MNREIEIRENVERFFITYDIPLETNKYTTDDLVSALLGRSNLREATEFKKNKKR